MLGVLAGAALGGLIFGRSGDSKHEHIHHNYNRTTIEEKKAPTDESVKLLMEMEEEARKQVTRAFITNGNVFNGAIIEIQNSTISLSRTTFAIFKLNGKTFEQKVEMEDREWDSADRPYEILCKLFAEQLAKEIVLRTKIKR